LCSPTGRAQAHSPMMRLSAARDSEVRRMRRALVGAGYSSVLVRAMDEIPDTDSFRSGGASPIPAAGGPDPFPVWHRLCAVSRRVWTFPFVWQRLAGVRSRISGGFPCCAGA
jgi:hypothetical protein